MDHWEGVFLRTENCLLPPALLLDLDIQSADFLVQGGEWYAEALGSFSLIPVTAFQHVGDDAAFEVFHMRGQTLTGDELVAALEAVAGRKLPVSRLPWFAIRAIAPFNETMREMLEMRYLWETPVLLDNSRLVARLGAEPHTPIVEALTAALAGLDALQHQPTALAA